MPINLIPSPSKRAMRMNSWLGSRKDKEFKSNVYVVDWLDVFLAERFGRLSNFYPLKPNLKKAVNEEIKK
ncbi:MAG: hypothetical protein F6K22_22150 [Okeania sp. SIO2F4]|uniref:hypothetical protein n=1 Tax=Okeania sp. SIO2F4 TaxID=2607790 RepID=UPI00142AB0D5|nr:hypothetical protein [Okeania sp. SIO2F4]NES05283.1 hypothetical protein [Okeania sp. SIO2F4]